MTGIYKLPAPSARWELLFPENRRYTLARYLEMPSPDGIYRGAILYEKARGTYLGSGGFDLRIHPDRTVECGNSWQPIIEDDVLLGFFREFPR